MSGGIMTHRILFVVGALLFLSLIEAVYAADLASFCRETAKKPTVAIWASPYDMTQSLVS